MLLKLLPSLALFSAVSALGQKQTIGFTASHDAFQLFGSSHGNHESSGQILVSPNDYWGVQKAAGDLATDFGRVTGTNLSLTAYGAKTAQAVYKWHAPTSDVVYAVGPEQQILGPLYTKTKDYKDTVIIVGTIGHSTLIDQLIKDKKIDVSKIKGKWESFVSQVVKNPLPGVPKALVIAGADTRGSIFGIYDVSEQIGVSPFWFWADTPAQKHSEIYALSTVKVQGPPSVKYRGLFINDEQPGLTNWVNNNYKPGKYGPGMNHLFFSTIFELLLRLRANYLWPAMWNGMFNVDDYENQPLADAYAIVMGSSHTEPMMRATNEWGQFGEGAWRWDTNNASVRPFFEYGAKRAKPYINNSLFTMAMRGSGDTAIPLTRDKAIKAATDSVTAQREILDELLADEGKTAKDIPQMWCLYKEVQDYFEGGMSVPEDVTLLWTDDNWGNVRRVPIGDEKARSGGAGIYYHFDYVGDPRNYKWINTINLAKSVEQMKITYEHGADRIWIVNVGDLKGLEIPINHYFDLAYNIDQWGYDSVPQWLRLWAAREFGSKYADAIGAVADKYGILAARRKYEMLSPGTYSVINYNEAETVLGEWAALASDAQKLHDSLPVNTQASFFETVLHPVTAGYTVYKIYVKAAQNDLYVKQRRTATNSKAQDVLTDFNTDAAITKKFHTILGGKWNGIMDQAHLGYDYWQQPMRNSLPPLAFVQTTETSVAGNLGVGIEGSNATVSGDDQYHDNGSSSVTSLPLEPYGPKTRYLEVFSRGTQACKWSIASPSYLKVEPSTGVTGPQQGSDVRVHISVPNWSKVTETQTAILNFTSSCDWGNYNSPQVKVPVIPRSIPGTFAAGFVESDGHVSIEAEHSTKSTTAKGAKYITLPNHGRSQAAVSLSPITSPSLPAGTGPVLEYDFFTFSEITAPANITLFLSPSLNFLSVDRPLKYAIAVDGETPQTIQFVGTVASSSSPPGWGPAVADAAWGVTSGRQTTTMHSIAPGKHTLKFWAVEPGVVLQKIVIDLGGVRKSYLGPPESFRVGVSKVGTYDGTTYLSQ
ncbi:hypothetical protein V500_11192 [Pseudogymnoascus sp. VKM F-4518 (FW-2643)]|nr:hypothetical protein V500_11192 [Pseudogymnoascus sp. VKM F-4518 (FW-2643)]